MFAECVTATVKVGRVTVHFICISAYGRGTNELGLIKKPTNRPNSPDPDLPVDPRLVSSTVSVGGGLCSSKSSGSGSDVGFEHYNPL